MKKYLVVLSILIPTFCCGQNITYSTSDTLLNVGESIDVNDVLIYNPSDEDLELIFTLEQICYLPEDETEMGMSINGLHMNPVDETTTWGIDLLDWLFLEVPNNSSSGFFSMETYPGESGSTWDLIVFDRNNITNSDTLRITVIQEECFTLTNEMDVNELIGQVYPNPIQNISILPINSTTHGELIIINLLGKEIQTISLHGGMNEIEISANDFQAGLYFYYFKNEFGVSATHSFVVEN